MYKGRERRRLGRDLDEGRTASVDAPAGRTTAGPRAGGRRTKLLDFSDPLVQNVFPAVRLVLEADGSTRWAERGWTYEPGPFGWLAGFSPADRADLRRAFFAAAEAPGRRVPVRLRQGEGADPWLGAFVSATDCPDVAAVMLRHDVRVGTGFRDLVARTGLAAFELDAEGRTLAVNDRWQELVGVSESEVLDRSWIELVHPEDRDLVLAGWERARTQGEAAVNEFRISRAAAEELWVAGRVVRLQAPGGGDQGYLGVLEDVTERRRAAELLRQSEERLRSVLASSLDIVVVLDEEGRFSFISPSAEALLGYDIEAWTGRHVFDLIHPDDLARVAESMIATRAVAGARGVQELRIRHADGTWREVESLSRNMLDDPVVRGVVVSIRDTTERHRARENLRDAQNRFREVFESSAVGMGTIAPDGRYTRANPALCEMLGYSLTELLTVDAYDLVHPDDPARDLEFWNRLVRNEEKRVATDSRLRRSDGSWLWARLSASLVRDEAGEPRYVVVQVEDVSARRQVEQQLEHDATHDRLTGLPNHALAASHLQRALAGLDRSAGSVGVLYVDLDHFKQVNDSLGHAAGDDVIRGVAARLRSVVRAGDLPARVGGDEFIVLCGDLAGVGEAVEIAERVVAALREPFDVGGRLAHVGASVGVALASAAGTLDADGLVAQADAAAYRAKDMGRDRVEVYDDALRRRFARRRSAEEAIRRALASPSLALRCDPIVNLADRAVDGFVVEIDWAKLAPREIVLDELPGALAASGLAVTASRRLLEQAAALLGGWRTGPGDRPVRLLVPLAAHYFRSGDIVAEVVGLASAVGSDASYAPDAPTPPELCLGVPEEVLSDDPEAVLEVLAGLRAAGVGLALERFGRGHTRLDVLRRLPVQSALLDEALTAEVGADGEASSLVSVVLGLAQTLGLRTMASGVSPVAQLDALAALGCGWVRGPAVARSVTPEQAKLLVRPDAA